jgi:hypothetical protein
LLIFFSSHVQYSHIRVLNPNFPFTQIYLAGKHAVETIKMKGG